MFSKFKVGSACLIIALMNISISANQLQDLSELMLKSHPELRALSHQVQELQSLESQSGYIPEPKLSVSQALEPVETRQGPQVRRWTLSQQFPAWGERQTEVDLAQLQAQMARLKLQELQAQKLYELRLLWVDLSHVQFELLARQEVLLWLESQWKVLNQGYLTAKVSFQDLLKLDNTLAEWQEQNLEVKSQLKQVRWKIEELLAQKIDWEKLENSNSSSSTNPLDHQHEITPLIPLHHIKQLKVADVLALQMADLAIKKAKLLQSQSKLSHIPEFDLGLYYSEVDRGPQPSQRGEDAWGVQLGVKLPIYIGKNKELTRSTSFALDAAQAKKQSVNNQLQLQLQTLVEKSKNLQRRYRLYQDKLIPNINKSIEVEMREYQSNQASFHRLVESKKELFQAQLMAHHIQLQQIQVRAEIANIQGQVQTQNWDQAIFIEEFSHE